MLGYRAACTLVATAIVVACTDGFDSDAVGAKPSAGSGLAACVPGRSDACTGPASCRGYQVCTDDGTQFGPCVCDEATDAALPDPREELKARCVAPDGEPLTLSTAEVPGALTGRWWFCNGANELDTVEFTSDGKWYELSYVGGSFVRNLGGATSGTYVVEEEDAASSVLFDIRVTFSNGMPCCDYALRGSIQTYPPGKMQLGGGRYVRMP